MNNKEPLNPTNSASAAVNRGSQQQQSQSSDVNSTGQTNDKKARRPRGQRVKRSKTKSTVDQIKAFFQAKVGGLDNSTLKMVLLTCGITAAVALAVIALIKFLPLGIALLALLGLGVVLSMCERLRYIVVYPRL